MVLAATVAGLGWFGLSREDGVRTSLTSRVLQAAPPRLGINLGGWSFWGADQFASNILKNPGFEGLIDGAIAIPNHAGGGAFDDAPSWLARADDFWEGARYVVLSGRNAGREGQILRSFKANTWGLPSFVARTGNIIPGVGDATALRRENESAPPTQWWYSSHADRRFMPEVLQTRPQSPGRRSLRISAPDRNTSMVASYLDSIGERSGKLLPLDGSWILSFWARLDKGNASLRIVFGREGSSPIFTRQVEVGSTWRNVEFQFLANDDGPVAPVGLRFEVTGAPAGDVLLDDVDLRRDQDRGFPFRREVVEVLERLRPAYLRDWQGQLGDSLANRLANSFARKSYRYRPGDDTQTDYGYGLRDFLDLCVRVNASPWIVLPTVLTEAECGGLGAYLAQQPDLARFPEILVEFGNENWNSLFRPAGIPDPIAHGHAADRCFRAMKLQARGMPIRTVINAHVADPAGAIRYAQASAESDLLALAPYFLHSLPAGLSLRQRLSMLAQQASAGLPALPEVRQELAVYEVNLHTVDGDASADERRPVVAGIAAGSALARNMMETMARGVRRQCAYSLTGFDSRLTTQPGYVPLWGMVRDLGPTRRFRPTALALQLLNEAIVGDLVEVDSSGQNDVAAYGFRSASDWSQVLISSAPDPRRVTVTAPTGVASLQVRELVAESLEATNETGQGVSIRSRSLPLIGGKAELVLGPLSVAVLSRNAAATGTGNARQAE